MNTKKDSMDVADRLEENVIYLRTLLLAAEDKLQFYFSNKALLGPNWELLSLYVAELENLLGLAERCAEGIGEDVDTVTDRLLKANLPCAAE